MKNYLKIILSYVLIFVIMVGSFGITIHNHVCGHSGTTFSSLFEDNDCECDHHGASSHQVEVHSPSCCAIPQTSEIENNSTELKISGDACCSDYSDTKSLNSTFLIKNLNKEVTANESFSFIDRIENSFNKFKNDINCKFKSLKQKLKNFTSFTLKVIGILNYYIHKDNPDDRQTA